MMHLIWYDMFEHEGEHKADQAKKINAELSKLPLVENLACTVLTLGIR